MINPFFKNKGPKKIEEILTQIKFQSKSEYNGVNISDIKDLVTASNKDITFFHSKKYELAALKTKAAFCITTKNLSNKLPDTCKPIEVDNVLVSTSMITTMFYPDAITDDFDIHTMNIEKTSYNVSVKIEGLAASAATIIALSGSELPVMSENSFFMIHNAWMPVVSMAGMNSDEIRDYQEELEKQAQLMDKINLKLAKIF